LTNKHKQLKQPKPVYEQSSQSTISKPKSKPKAPPAPINPDKTPLSDGDVSLYHEQLFFIAFLLF